MLWTKWTKGFYFIRSNERSKILFRSMMYSGDIIIACRSHQQVLIALLEEYNSLFGLTVKVLSREEGDFPGGYHYHMRKDIVKKMVNGEIKPYIFHMSWTLNKVNKLEYMKQMGMWFVKEQCIGKQVDEIFAGEVDTTDNTETCCSAEPIIQCFYRDKPSVVPCRDAPACTITRHICFITVCSIVIPTLLLSPPRFPISINRWTVSTRDLTGFITIMTRH
mmetsp:Transcript_20206/g.40578  ORF Transcript_20206/g.40578 Transcript_20206/m.40578 type:complete len:220 (-) Transcript_20206:1988-2647(-)